LTSLSDSVYFSFLLPTVFFIAERRLVTLAVTDFLGLLLIVPSSIEAASFSSLAPSTCSADSVSLLIEIQFKTRSLMS